MTYGTIEGVWFSKYSLREEHYKRSLPRAVQLYKRQGSKIREEPFRFFVLELFGVEPA
jgi:hypothetical protein